MFRSLLLSDSLRHPVEFAARACDLAVRLFLARTVHLRQGFGEPPAGAMQEDHRHLQIALESGRGRTGGRWLPLRFQKQFRLGEDALANHARSLPPGGIELPGLPCVPTALDKCRGHPLAVLEVEARHRHKKPHRQVRRDLALAHLLLDGFRQ